MKVKIKNKTKMLVIAFVAIIPIVFALILISIISTVSSWFENDLSEIEREAYERCLANPYDHIFIDEFHFDCQEFLPRYEGVNGSS